MASVYRTHGPALNPRGAAVGWATVSEESAVQLLGPVEIRALAEELDVTPTKKLGQNFVHDPNTVRRIVDAAELSPDDHVVEVGPGLGSLTLGLLDTVQKVTAVEIDPRLAGRLEQTVSERAASVADRLTVVLKDALTVTPDDVDKPTALVANLPYNVSVPVLLHFLEVFPSIKRVLVMVQLEVADRLAAKPGSKIYGVPSVKAAFYGDVRKAGTIGKNVFWPAPKIESGLVRIDVFEDAPWPRSAREQVFPLIDAAFAQRRKTLRAALSSHFGGGPAAESALQEAGIEPTQRGEKLGVADFVRLGASDVSAD
ncbi:dimethyladenosine transferase [Corynebacterium renale]|nr:dimethyladenosine transferase [Corynebacterium renale]STC94877.1 dimethyladenosine transferase [Corynebacterium renale]